MAVLTLQQIKNLPEFTYATGIYYKKFPWRIQFWQPEFFRRGFHKDLEHENAWRTCMIRNMDINSLLKNQLGYERWKVRRDRKFFVYLTEHNLISKLVDRWGEDILQIQGPINQKHQELMIDNLDLVTKKELWYNKFRYKVSFTRHGRQPLDILSEIFEFVDETFDANNYQMNHIMKRSIRHKTMHDPYTNTGTIFLKEYDDVATLHLMFKKHITSTKKCVLINEL